MAEISNYLENAIINATLRATTFTSPSTVYVSLHTADPTDAGTGTEVSGGSYARKTATFGAPSNGVSTTTANVEFDVATAYWGIITHIGIFDALTTGNLLYHTALDASKEIDTNDIFRITAGNLTVTIT
jgi:hypothetical protein